MKKYKKSEILIHHTALKADNDKDPQFESVDRLHKNRWNEATESSLLLYGGYHYLIERDGEIRQYREDWEVGAHCRNGIKWINGWRYSANYYALGVCFAGNISLQQLTEAQIKAGVELIRELRDKHLIGDENIHPHRRYKNTQCPGNNLNDNTWKHLQELESRLEQKLPGVVKWHKKNKIIEKWNSPPTDEEMKLGWTSYKLAKAIVEGRLSKKDFNL